jgi:CheY-like chemotaxis protein
VSASGYKSKTVLICEDNHMNFFVLQKLIQNSFPEINILHGLDGIEGVDLFNSNKIDVVITDIEMPEMDGWEFIEVLKKNDFDMHKVIVVSAQSVETMYPNAVKLGIRKCYSKPINPKAIEEIGKIISEKVEL